VNAFLKIQVGAVLIVRATKKLRQRLGTGRPHDGEPSTTLLGDWHATALPWRPRQLFLRVLIPPRTVHDCDDHEDDLVLDLAAEVGALLIVSEDTT
jgi:hypothetical protein